MTVRTHPLHIAAIRAACEQGRALREQARTLTGDAAGEHDLTVLDPTVAARLADEVTVTATTRAEPVDAELVHKLPVVLALLTDVLSGDEHGPVPTSELATRIDWNVKALGEALRAAGVSKAKRRMPGHDNPVSVVDADTIRAAIGDCRGRNGRSDPGTSVPIRHDRLRSP
ncbi:hypothetical protein [Saccharothrix deserti]|uniref:hypothetical protein n=1 Tax=Saccharothrix deserti TaxID=2593674 RepID=UPI00131BDE9A|nr:hypothetical protein [Saccharothrix deserti]